MSKFYNKQSKDKASLWFDDLFIDNNLMVKSLISRELKPTTATNTWIMDGCHISSKRLPSKSGVYVFEFLGNGFSMKFEAVYDANMQLNNRKSIIKWVSDPAGESVGDRGATARRALNNWLKSVT